MSHDTDQAPQGTPQPLPQVTLVLQPDGNVALRTNVKDLRVLNRMLAAGLMGANQEQAPPKPSVLTGRFVPKVNGLRG